jgi:hypothetical protein
MRLNLLINNLEIVLTLHNTTHLIKEKRELQIISLACYNTHKLY